MTDLFASLGSGLDSPANTAFVPAQSDTVDLEFACRGLYIGGDGDVKLNTTGGSTVTFTGLTAGMVLPVRCARIWSTGTTATGLIGLL